MPNLLRESLSKAEIPPKYALPILWHKWVYNRVMDYDYNYMHVITGDTGSGKTVAGVIHGYIHYKIMRSKGKRIKFDESNVCLSAKEFIDKVRDSKRGEWIIWDESGVGLDSRKWQSISNILTGQILQTYREKNLVVYMILPDFSFLDIRARKLANGFSIMERETRSGSIEWLYKIKVNRRTGEIYYPYPRFYFDGGILVVPKIHIPKSMLSFVPKEVWNPIKKKISRFKDMVLEANMRDAEVLEEERWEALRGPRGEMITMAKKVLSNPQKYQNDKGELDWRIVSFDLGISRDKAKMIVYAIKKELLPSLSPKMDTKCPKSDKKSPKKGDDETLSHNVSEEKHHDEDSEVLPY